MTGIAALCLTPVTPVTRLLAVGAGACLGLAIGSSLADGALAPLAILLVVGALLVLLVRAVTPPEQRGWLYRIVAVAFLLRIAAAGLLYWSSIVSGGGGFVTGDDIAYASLAWHLVQFLRGDPHPPYVPPDWGGEGYLFGPYVYLESAIFFIFGKQILAVVFINAGFAAAMLVLLADIARRLFGRTAAVVTTVVIAFYPSVLVWSALNLKDALVLLLITIILWVLHRYSERRALVSLGIAYLLLLSLDSLRRYIFFELALIVPFCLAFQPVLASHARLRRAAVAGFLSASLLWYTGAGAVALQPFQALAALESVRQAMGIGARTAFVTPPPTSTPTAAPTLVPTQQTTPVPTQQATPVPTQQTLLSRALEFIGGAFTAPTKQATPAPTPQAAVAPTSATPIATPIATPVATPAATPVATAVAPTEELIVGRTLAHLPRGVAYALFAPFPWEVQRVIDVAPVLEMLLWYVILGAMSWTVWRERRRWRSLAPEVLLIVMTLSLFALFEGNVGTLYRHRSMVIPFAVVLASPSLRRLAASISRRSHP